jgi:hypothetical protein
MFIEYVAYTLKDKIDQGHCRNSTHPKQCSLTADLHLDMLKRLKADLETLAGEIGKEISARGGP